MALDLGGGRSARLPQAGIVVWCSGLPLRIAGVELWRRAVYLACRAGFERLRIVSGSATDVRRELADDRRLEARRWEVVSTDDWAERIAAGERWVCLDDRWIVGADHLVELAATRGEAASADPQGPVAVDGGELASWSNRGWTPAAPAPAVGRPVERPALYVRVTSAADVARAEDALFQSLGRNAPTFLARHVDRAMSRAISRRLAPYPVTPNQITLFSIALGIVGALCLVPPSYAAGVLGTLLFLASTILDGCDGEIARLKFQESAAGAKLDVVGDNVVHAVLFPAVALHAYLAHPNGPYLWLGAVALLGVLVTWLVVYRLIVRTEPSARLLKLFEAFANREFAYLLLFLAVIDEIHWFVWGMSIGLWLFPIALLALRASEK